MSYGFIYLGICGGGCKGKDIYFKNISVAVHMYVTKLRMNQLGPNKLSGSIGTECAAYCGHAYMVNKRRAKDLYKTLYTSKEGKYVAGIFMYVLVCVSVYNEHMVYMFFICVERS